jgi:hypothetical protein
VTPPGSARFAARVLRPGGLLLLAFHVGDETVHLDEWWGQRVSVNFLFFRPEEMADSLRAAGFEIEDIVEREPYPDVEHQSRRAYIFAKKPELAINLTIDQGMSWVDLDNVVESRG